MLAVTLYPHEFDFIFQLGYIIGVASNITLLLMSALLGTAGEPTGLVMIAQAKQLLIRLHVALRTNPYPDPIPC